MSTETIVRFFIYAHAAMGGIALLSGGIALAAKKGKKVHKKAGSIFFFSMLSAAVVSLPIALSPNHQNLFLFAIGIFSTYLILSGYRATSFAKMSEDTSIWKDKSIAWSMMAVGVAMIALPVYQYTNGDALNIVLIVFGVIGLSLAMRDLKMLKDRVQLKKGWLKLHITKMVAGYIAATTAFVVVNGAIPGIYGWLAPTVLGSVYITYWMMKLDKAAKKKAASPAL